MSLVHDPDPREGAAGPAPRDRRLWAAILAVAVLANLLALSFVRQERVLYFGENLRDWELAARLATSFRQDPLLAVGEVLASLRTQDGSLLAAAPIALLLLVLGSSRLAYVLCATNLYLVPALAVLLVLFWRIAQPRRRVIVVAALLVGLQPLAWAALLRGLPDIGGVFLVGLALLRYLGRPWREQTISAVVGLGLVLAVLVLYRGWYGHWVAAFLIVTAVDALVTGWRGGRGALGPTVVRLLVLAGTACGVLAVVAWPVMRDLFLRRTATSLGAGLRSLVDQAGAFQLGLALAALAWGALRPRRRRVVLVLGAQAVVALLLFCSGRTPGLSGENALLVLPHLVVLALLLVDDWLAAVGELRRLAATAAVSLVCFLSTLSFLSVLGPPREAVAGPWAPLMPRLRVRPLIRSDLDELARLIATLEGLARSPVDSIYLLADGHQLNPRLLQAAELSLHRRFPVLDRFEPTHSVDLRDGFPSRLLRATLVVTTDPPQIHLPPSQQQVILLPARQLLEGRGVGVAYERLPVTFRIEHGYHAVIFRRRRVPRPEEVQVLSEELKRVYPHSPHVTTPRP
jgi:hypothetical protein